MTNLNHESILITDDEPNIRLLLRTVLGGDGYRVEEAADGRFALEAIQRTPFDLLLLDLNMPRLDGMGLLKEMRTIDSPHHPRVIVLTAYGSIPAAVKATQLGAADFLEKPITPDELRRTVRGVLDDPPPHLATDPAHESHQYAQVLDRIRRSMRLAELDSAESMLMKVAERSEQQSAEYFNLLGVVYEAQKRYRLARKCFVKAVDADPAYEPAKNNIFRLSEMQSIGSSERQIMLGDEPDDVWYFQSPPAAHS